MQTIILLGLVSLLTDISSEMVYPLLSLYLTTTLGATPAIIGVIEGIAESLASLLKVYSGYLSDKTQKRKPLAIFGYGAATVGKLFLYLSSSWGWVRISMIFSTFSPVGETNLAVMDSLIKERDIMGIPFFDGYNESANPMSRTTFRKCSQESGTDFHRKILKSMTLILL